jgi:hypothetical protein
MRFIAVVFLLLVASAGAYITRPTQGLHRGVATELMKQGKAERPDKTSGRYEFEDYYVVTFSAMSAGDRQLLQCWGAFTRFLCVGPAGGPQAPDPASVPAPA